MMTANFFQSFEKRKNDIVSVEWENFLNRSSIPFYQVTSEVEVNNSAKSDDDLTILDDFDHIKNSSYLNNFEDNFLADEYMRDDEDEYTCQMGADRLNFQEYSIQYLDGWTPVNNSKNHHFFKDIITTSDLEKQAHSSPKEEMIDVELDSMVSNLSIDEINEIDCKVRANDEIALDDNEELQANMSFDFEEFIKKNDKSQQEQEQEIDDKISQNSDDSMDIDVILPDTGKKIPNIEKNSAITAYEKLNGPLKFPSKVSSNKPPTIPLPSLPHSSNNIATTYESKIPIRCSSKSSATTRFNNIIQIHHDPIKTTTISSSLSSKYKPISLYKQTLKKSTRLNPDQYSRILKSPKRICSPKKQIKPLKPALKECKNLLNLIVDASTGNVKDATRFGTEINSQNSEGVPLPESVKELVTIPTNNANVTHKAAIIRAINVKALSTTNSFSKLKFNEKMTIGFYNEQDFKKYISKVQNPNAISQDKENQFPTLKETKILGVKDEIQVSELKKNKSKSVKWAQNLEW
ncbi:hypothetical protein PACTADRAFT_48235 [Pachysolen tannophilus NRRL Y-2460]|uniref:Uncharacterized protein n=1 Tax=Pachysolen tannophilus NRRL Y-2460 TaxID=669874 RepID=A0A1E4U3A1_PACTA|nr:hypothetical protein PACTADRAFT_48235 [Pachysolen tannophilus NRRL Y-2460]